MDRGWPSFANFLTVSNPGKKLIGILPVILLFASLGINELFHGLARGGKYSLFGGIISLAISLFFAAMFYQFGIRQYKTIRDVFLTGVEVEGVVTDIHFGRKIGYVFCEYAYQNLAYRSENKIQESEKSKQIQVGQKVRLFVNPDKPSQSFIRELYL